MFAYTNDCDAKPILSVFQSLPHESGSDCTTVRCYLRHQNQTSKLKHAANCDPERILLTVGSILDVKSNRWHTIQRHRLDLSIVLRCLVPSTQSLSHLSAMYALAASLLFSVVVAFFTKTVVLQNEKFMPVKSIDKLWRFQVGKDWESGVSVGVVKA